MVYRYKTNLLDFSIPEDNVGNNLMLAVGLNSVDSSHCSVTAIRMLNASWYKKKARAQIVQTKEAEKQHWTKTNKRAHVANTFVLPAELLWEQPTDEV